MNRLLQYTRTLCYLRPQQVLALISNRLQRPSTKLQRPERVGLRPGIGIIQNIQDPLPPASDFSFRFLNQEKTFSNRRIDWVSEEMSKLWRYNLHYFDYLNDRSRSLEHRKQLVTDWVQHTRPGMGDAWEPYTVSLRIVNWIKFFLAPNVTFQQEWVESLYQQTLWLERNIEYHILANHYLKNGVALFFAGMYFEGDDAERWIKKGVKILREELDEQFLQDGGHYERSPMYHSLCVMDYLDVLNLMAASRDVMTFNEFEQFKAQTTRALHFLNAICLPDGEIPLLNDSAFGIASQPNRIDAYASLVIGYTRPDTRSELSVTQHPQSGYYVLRKDQDMMIIDCGEIGPRYQPGHAHCDTLSYELAVNGRRMIVDSGVYDYEHSRQRAYARSTRAHNTVTVDDEEQSEIWGVFRVARRARPTFGWAKMTSDDHAVFEGAHDGYTRLPGALIHRRRIEYDGHSHWLVVDRMEGTGRHRANSYIHLHPDFTADIEGRRVSIRDTAGHEWASFEMLDDGEISLEESWYYPEFGREIKNQAIVYACTGAMPLSLAYRITIATNGPAT